MTVRIWSVLGVACLAFACGPFRGASGDEKTVPVPRDSDEVETNTTSAAITENSYKLPSEDNVAAIFEAVDKMKSLRPATADETNKHRRKLRTALRQAADRIMKLEADHLSPAYRWATCYSLDLRAQALGAATEDERNRFVEQVKELLAAKVDGESLKLVSRTADLLEAAGFEAESAAALEAFLPEIAKSGEPIAKRKAKEIAAVLRRLKLIGSPMELAGKTMDGKPFAISELKGKVVLVDFWATWCGPCVAAMPELKKAYAAYKDKGFEIVGVSHDRDRAALEGYLKSNEIGWITLHDPEENGRPAASEAYGIRAIPTMFLISTDGKVLNGTLREDSLMKELEKLLGPPATAVTEPEKGESPEKNDSKEENK